MKLSELVKKFKNKYAIRIVAGVLTIVLLGSAMTVVAVQADQKEAAVGQNKEETAQEETDLSELISVESNDQEIGKEETVYLMSDATGKVHDTIVSDHLINNGNAARIEDRSNLRDIENVKGNETFEQDGEQLSWNADGNDIFYRGTTDEEAPVTQKVTYYLDGEEIMPEELAGKSGKVTIHFEYENNTSYGEVKVPFAAVTAMVLDGSFTNIEVKNGKIENNGDNCIVIGYALPGIRESLDVEESNFAEELDLPEDFEVTADVENFELDTAMTIVANAGSIVSIKNGDSSSLEDMINDLSDASSQLRDGSADLAKGMDTFQKGLADYASGMSELYKGSGDLGKGVEALNKSAASISKGIQTLDKGLKTTMSEEEKTAAKKSAEEAVAKEFKNGKTKEVADQIYAALRYTKNGDQSAADGALYSSLYDGAYSANAAETVYNEVVRQVLLTAAGQPADSKLSADQAAEGIKAVYAKGAQANDPTASAMYAVTDGMTSAQLAELLYAKSGAKDTLFQKTQSAIQEQLAAGRNNEQINSAVESSLRQLSEQLAGACQDAAAQAAGSAAISGAESTKGEIAAQIEAVQSNGYSLVTGAAALSKGTQSLADQVPDLTNGITALNEAVVKLTDGADDLQDGSHELADGMVEFDKEGISKIVNSYNGDMKPFTDRLQAMFDAGEDYQTFTLKEDGINGNVKFIYKLDSIKAEDVQ